MRFSAQEFQVAVQSKFGVGLTCFTAFTDRTLKSRAFAADKRAGVHGSTI